MHVLAMYRGYSVTTSGTLAYMHMYSTTSAVLCCDGRRARQPFDTPARADSSTAFHASALDMAARPIVLLCGRTGSGKSETGNTLLGKPAFKAQRAFSSVTLECKSESTEEVTVVDTPGLSDTQEDPTTICTQVAEFIKSSQTPAVHAILIVVSATERFTQDLTAGVRLMEAALGEGCLKTVGTVVFTRGGELVRDGISAASLVSGGPPGLRELVERCGGRVVLVENRDSLPPATEGEAHWAARKERGAELLRATCLPAGCDPLVLDESLDAAALRAMPAATALTAASALQATVGATAASEVTDEKLNAAFQTMLATMRERGQSQLAAALSNLDAPSTDAPLELDFAASLPDCLELPPQAKAPPAGSKLWLSAAVAAMAPARLVVGGTARFLSGTRLWAGGSISRGTHRLKVHGPAALTGSARLRSPPGLTLVIRGPITLAGPLKAHVAPRGGLGAGDEWLAEGILRCTLSARASGVSATSGSESVAQDISDGATATAAAGDAVSSAFCELHGATASDEVQRSEAEASALELEEGTKLQIFEGGSLWIDGSAGVEPPPGQTKASVLIEKEARLEVYGLADLTITGEAALAPAHPRKLAQIIHG